MAFSTSRRLLVPPGDPQIVVREVNAIRRTLAHGNYEQAAREAGCESVDEYFQKQYTVEIEGLFRILEALVQQIDAQTGRRHAR
jgi:hypothetical protein